LKFFGSFLKISHKRTYSCFKNKYYFFRDKNGKEVDLLIDKGLEIIPVEIKAGQTFNEEFTKNLQYYAKLMKEENQGTLVFSGKSQKRTKLNIYNYMDFFKSFYQ